MKEVSVLVGGKAGDGINSAGSMVAQLMNHLGYRIYMYFDYPSLIRGGHNFTVIRGSEQVIGSCRNTIDFILALNQETVTRHRDQLNPEHAVIFNADLVKADGQGVPVKSILEAEHAPGIMGNSAIIGGFAKTASIDWETVEAVFRAHTPKGVDLNLKVARLAYDQLQPARKISRCDSPALPLLSGNEAIGLGMVRGGLQAYISYPMTPSSSLLHFLAEQQERLGITVVHPENEIGVILMALGFSYAGKRTAVGTSGGGFCLMSEGVSFAGMAELPVVLVVSQRTGPSTGLPTYTGQTDLRFILNAGQGEFPRLIVAPGTAQEALYWSAAAVDLAWKFQVPAFILADKTLSEGTYSVNDVETGPPGYSEFIPWDGAAPYRRYADTPSGVSPLAFPGEKGAVVKVNSYAHDEAGITTEEAQMVEKMTEKRLRKWNGLMTEMDKYPAVNVAGDAAASTALLCWGSTRCVCAEVAAQLGLKVVQPVVLSPLPVAGLKKALRGVDRLVAVEENATAQLVALTEREGIFADHKILRYDGRPFTVDDLAKKVRDVIA